MSAVLQENSMHSAARATAPVVGDGMGVAVIRIPLEG